jgi:hypothetical protein
MGEFRAVALALHAGTEACQQQIESNRARRQHLAQLQKAVQK